MAAPIKLLFVTADEFPTHRVDVSVLFGTELPRHGIFSDVVAQLALGVDELDASWPAGRAFLCHRTGARARDQIAAFRNDFRMLMGARAGNYDAIQVRDKVFAGVVALFVARRRKLPFLYWMSFPMSEGFIDMARREGLSLGLTRWAFLSLKGHLGRYLLYRFLLPRSDHVFLQSDRMAAAVSECGIPESHITAVPMGVDLGALSAIKQCPSAVRRHLAGRRVLAYQGSLDRVRRIDLLFEVLHEVRAQVPDACLLLVGESTEAPDREWLESRARELGLEDAVIWTGWVSRAEAWGYLQLADVAVSLIPRGELFDWSSPTKVVEYLALGLPVVANDLPDQHQVLTESGAGLSVGGDVKEFAEAVVRILNDESLAAAMRVAGPPYVRARRSYSKLGEQLAAVYRTVLSETNRP